MIDGSDGFYWNPVEVKSRSRVNIPVRITGPEGSAELEAKFLRETEEKGMLSLKGHRSVGGLLRISLFNAISVEDAISLRDFMILTEESPSVWYNKKILFEQFKEEVLNTST